MTTAMLVWLLAIAQRGNCPAPHHVDWPAQHPVWSRVRTDEGARVRAAEFAVALAWTRRDGLFTLADDPWQDLDLLCEVSLRVGRRILK